MPGNKKKVVCLKLLRCGWGLGGVKKNRGKVGRAGGRGMGVRVGVI